MDAFFASIEQNDNPAYHHQPIAVGGGEVRGVVAAASYEARTFGVRSAMPGWQAKQLCPDLIFVKPRFDRYKEISNQIREVFFEVTKLVEPLSLDEAYLDVTKNKLNNPSATLLAQQIRNTILKRTGLTASAGISYNKFLAKVASDINKPNGQKVILPSEAEAFLEALPIEKFFGIGKVTAKKMKASNIFTGKDLKQISMLDMIKRFGKHGAYYYKIVRGIDDRPVKVQREIKSISVERTYPVNLTSLKEMEDKIIILSDLLLKRLKRKNKFGRTIILKTKTPDFKIFNRSKTFSSPVSDIDQIKTIGLSLMRSEFPRSQSVRLLGLGTSNFPEDEAGQQLSLF